MTAYIETCMRLPTLKSHGAAKNAAGNEAQAKKRKGQ